MSTINVITVENSLLKFFLVLMWDKKESTPTFITKGGLVNNYIDKLFANASGTNMRMKCNGSDRQKENIDLIRATYRRINAARFKNPIIERKDAVAAFTVSDPLTFSSKVLVEKFITTISENYDKQGYECVGIYLNGLIDYSIPCVFEYDKPKIKVINDEVGSVNILVIKDKLLNTYFAFPWKLNGSVHKQNLLTGDFVYFKRFLLDYSQTEFNEMGIDKSKRKDEWCNTRFFKLLNNDINGIEIENYPINGTNRLVDCLDLYISILKKEGVENLMNYPEFSGGDKKMSELYELIGVNQPTITGLMMSDLLSVKNFKDLKFLTTSGQTKDFSKMPDSSYTRTCNSSSDIGISA